MSQLSVDSIAGRVSGSAPSFPNGAVVTGVVTATSFSGDVTGNVNGTATVATTLSSAANITTGTISNDRLPATITKDISGTSAGLSGSPSIVVTDVQVGGALTVTGNLTVNGTQTTLNTATLSVEDKNIGIGSVSNPSNTTADGAGITIFAGSDEDKTITWGRGNGCFEFSDPCKFNGVVEKISAGTTYMSGSDMVLELNVRTATVFTHTGTTDVGIVSFTGMPADTGISNGTTITLIHTQNATGTANTTGATGLGRVCTVVGYEDGAAVAGVTTAALVGAGVTVTLSDTPGDRDFVSFFIQYTGGTNTNATSYKVYATKNGGFRQG